MGKLVECIVWMGGVAMFRADGQIRDGSLVGWGPDGGVVEWRDGNQGGPFGLALTRAVMAGDEIRVCSLNEAVYV